MGDTPGLVSVGYEGRQLDELVDLLLAAGVEILIDVRLNAISRKKGFSKTALASALAEAGIAYRHERQLGNPKDNRDPFRKGLPTARIRYLNHLANSASTAIDEIVALARKTRVALLCFERDHHQCHRSCITTTAQSRNPHLPLTII